MYVGVDYYVYVCTTYLDDNFCPLSSSIVYLGITIGGSMDASTYAPISKKVDVSVSSDAKYNTDNTVVPTCVQHTLYSQQRHMSA